MNTANIKKYAPQARLRFIDAMTRQAARYGITSDAVGSGDSTSANKGQADIAPAEVRGDVLLISARDGQTHSFPKAMHGPREALARWVSRLGFEQAMEHAAYSWFNRLCAIRFMELKGYLDHGRRVLSHPDHAGGLQLLDECLEIDLHALGNSLEPARVRELKLDGTQDETLYRELLLAQCHALHAAMPFLFEPLDDASELLLPDNLTKTDSLIRELVEAIPEDDWQDVEVIGWLYQFYIADKKDEVIGKVVKSGDIPAATQLFTPNWIVQYLVQNSLGRQWLQTYPDSPLKGQMPYYIEPAEQEPGVQAELDAITPASLDPEALKVLDPAMGSGHILVEAYNVLKAIYEERGYRSRDIPRLILEHNLFGLDIDDRAAQLAGFTLMMKAREDDRRIFSRMADSSDNKARMNVMAVQSTQHLNADELWNNLNLTGDWHQGQSQSLFDSEQTDLSSNAGTDNDSTYKVIVDLIERFQEAKTFGSLIEVPNELETPLNTLRQELAELADSGDTMQKTAARQLLPIVQQAWVQAQRYDAVVANPPYMGSKGMNKALKDYAKKAYPNSKSDLFAIFMEHGFSWLKENAFNAMVTMQSWMFLSSYEKMRQSILDERTIETMVHMGNGVMKIAFGTNATVFRNSHITGMKGSFSYAEADDISDNGEPFEFPVRNERLKVVAPDDFKKIPGSPVAYWALTGELSAFENGSSLEKLAPTRKGMVTARNSLYVRDWHEVSISKTGLDLYQSREEAKRSGKKWFSYLKGGGFRRWYGNKYDVINWENDGCLLQTTRHPSEDRVWATNFNLEYIFQPNINWGAVTSSSFSARASVGGELFDAGGSACFPKNNDYYFLLAFLNSTVTRILLQTLNPTLNFQAGNISSLPIIDFKGREKISFNAKQAIETVKHDWDAFETSWDFTNLSLLSPKKNSTTIEFSYSQARSQWRELVNALHQIEKENNNIFIDAYGLQSLINPDVQLEEVTLTCNPHYRYGGNRSEEELETLLQCDTLKELVSYAIGCMMGRYSLDKPGLILASQGETVSDYLQQVPAPSFAPDKNAIIPLTDQEWFPDDATNRFRDFVRIVWGEENLQENLNFVAESLCLHAIRPKKGEAALDTIRRYLSTQFFKDHLRTYKKRPIYWLFSSGKQKAFECLVYLHRYDASTLAEMRTDYVIPLIDRLTGHVERLEQDKDTSASAADAKRIERELSKLYKQQTELNAFDEKLRHYADQRITLDLDDGVKVNYGKFGDLLAEVKQVTGVKPA